MKDNSAKNIREYYLDNFKVLLALLVVFAHVLIGYTFPQTPYMVRKEEIFATVPLQYFYYLCKVFLMGSFYFVAGYFLYSSLTRYSIYDIFKKRLYRYGIPIVFFQIYFFVFVKGSTPLTWFLEVLLILTIIFLLIHRKTKIYLAEVQMSFGKILLCGIVVGLVLGVLRIITHFRGFVSLPFIHIEISQFPKYFLMFYMGILANKNKWIDNLLLSPKNYYGIIVMAIMITVLGVVFRTTILTHLNSFSYAVFEGLQCVTINFSLLLLFKKWLSFSNNVFRFIGGQIMGIYLLNGFFIFMLQILLYDVEINFPIKICILFIGSTILTLYSSCLLKRIPLFKDFL